MKWNVVLTVYSIRHYIIKYIDMIIINYDYGIYCFDIGKMVVYREHIYVLPKIRYDSTIGKRPSQFCGTNRVTGTFRWFCELLWKVCGKREGLALYSPESFIFRNVKVWAGVVTSGTKQCELRSIRGVQLWLSGFSVYRSQDTKIEAMVPVRRSQESLGGQRQDCVSSQCQQQRGVSMRVPNVPCGIRKRKCPRSLFCL